MLEPTEISLRVGPMTEERLDLLVRIKDWVGSLDMGAREWPEDARRQLTKVWMIADEVLSDIESDRASIASNLLALDSLQPGDAVVLPTGEAWFAWGYHAEVKGYENVIDWFAVGDDTMAQELSPALAMPLLRAAVAGGAQVVRKEEG